MKNSKIEWTDHTFNPWEGCTKVSPGCANCYAEERNKRWSGGVNWGPGAPRRRTSKANWKEPIRWNMLAAKEIIAAKRTHPTLEVDVPRRPRVFCASLADWLDDEVPIEWLADLFHLINETPGLDWLLLTKRPQNWRRRVERCIKEALKGGEHGPRAMLQRWLEGAAPANVWIGTSVEDQPRFDLRAPWLVGIPARVRFLSCEPLLGSVDITKDFEFTHEHQPPICPMIAPFIHWVIVGGESGHAARPMNPVWAYDLLKQCQKAGVAFFFKQWGEWAPRLEVPDFDLIRHSSSEAQHVFPDISPGVSGKSVFKVGKFDAGRLLGGAEYNEVPR